MKVSLGNLNSKEYKMENILELGLWEKSDPIEILSQISEITQADVLKEQTAEEKEAEKRREVDQILAKESEKKKKKKLI